MNKRKQLELYRENMGDAAAERQAWRAKFLRTCCDTAKDQPHESDCKYRGRFRGK